MLRHRELETCTSNRDKFLNSYGAYVTLQYKQDVGKPEESNYAPLFSTSFDKYPDLSGATISYWGPTGILSLTAPMFLLAKGGNSDPYPAYFFDISSWNRIDRIDLSSFWVDPYRGSISYIAIYTTPDGGQL